MNCKSYLPTHILPPQTSASATGTAPAGRPASWTTPPAGAAARTSAGCPTSAARTPAATRATTRRSAAAPAGTVLLGAVCQSLKMSVLEAQNYKIIGITESQGCDRLHEKVIF